MRQESERPRENESERNETKKAAVIYNLRTSRTRECRKKEQACAGERQVRCSAVRKENECRGETQAE